MGSGKGKAAQPVAGTSTKYLTGVLGVLLVGGVSLLLRKSPTVPAPKLRDVYWGPGEEPVKLDQSIRPYKIVFEQQMIDDLKMRLRNTRQLQPPLEDVGWTYGVNSEFVPRLVDYWLNKYDFKKREAHLNRYPQFVTNVQGLDIHFLHVKPQLPRDRKVEVLPLYIQHGWPGSVVEFFRIIPMLTTVQPDRDYVFEVIAPSLPGFGFSSAAAKAGCGPLEIAHIMKNLMLRLGFTKWYTQGGDWGSVVVSYMAAMYPQHVLGTHSNMCLQLRPMAFLKLWFYNMLPSLLPEEDRQRLRPVSQVFLRGLEETGYFHIQATKPDTIGVGNSDSPAGIAAYILEKFLTATQYENKYGDESNMLKKFTMDELIDNIMLYWAPNKVTSSFRIYAEFANIHAFSYRMEEVAVQVPSACAQFPHELIYMPEAILRDRYVNLVSVKNMPRGGHFAAMEEPQLLADDVWATVGKMREYHEAAKRERQQSWATV